MSSSQNTPAERLANNKNILLIRLSSLGDVVLTTPAIRAVRAHFPHAHIAMLVAKQSADVLHGNPHLNEIVPFNRLADDKDTGEMWRVLRTLRKRKFALTIDFQGKFRTEVLAYLSGAAERVGKGRLCTVRVPNAASGTHATEQNLALLHAIGIPAEDRTLEMFLSESEREAASQRFEAADIRPQVHKNVENDNVVFGLRKDTSSHQPTYPNASRTTENCPIVGMFPGAGWKLREWMPERFAAIGDKLVRHFNAHVLIFGGPREVELVNTVANLMHAPAIPFAGNLQIRQLAACLEKCSLFLTNDTGPMHIAAAVGTPTVALFGPGNHHRFQPLGVLHQTIRHDVPCSPCKQFTDKCKDNVCMQQIRVDEVWETVRARLQSASTHTPLQTHGDDSHQAPSGYPHRNSRAR